MGLTLLVTVGLPGSGKSTWCGQIQQYYPAVSIVCPDEIRRMLYDDASIQGDWAVIVAVVEQQLRQAAQAIVQQRSPFAIYDATNAVPQHRCDAITLARACGFTSVIGIWFNVSQSTCLARNQHRSRQVPQAVIAQMQQALRQAPPQLPEGFDRILKIESEKLVPN